MASTNYDLLTTWAHEYGIQKSVASLQLLQPASCVFAINFHHYCTQCYVTIDVITRVWFLKLVTNHSFKSFTEHKHWLFQSATYMDYVCTGLIHVGITHDITVIYVVYYLLAASHMPDWEATRAAGSWIQWVQRHKPPLCESTSNTLCIYHVSDLLFPLA